MAPLRAATVNLRALGDSARRANAHAVLLGVCISRPRRALPSAGGVPSEDVAVAAAVERHVNAALLSHRGENLLAAEVRVVAVDGASSTEERLATMAAEAARWHTELRTQRTKFGAGRRRRQSLVAQMG